MGIRRTLTLLLCGYCAFVAARPIAALAQDANKVAIEGYVFEAKTSRPVPNVYVSYGYQDQNGVGAGFQALTDSNGFYQLEFDPPAQPVTVRLFALCKTKKHGQEEYDIDFYNPPRSTVYRRDFYIAYPKHATECIP